MAFPHLICAVFAQSIPVEKSTMKLCFKKYVLTVLVMAEAFVGVSAKSFTVVIDAGHGGKDVGAVGDFAKEKDINLGVALKVGEQIKKEHKDVVVVYTRDDDTFVSLQGRADIANKAKGDLFISIHTNSVDRRSKTRYTVCGSETYTLGLHRTKENLDVAKRENAVIELEDDYTTVYKGFNPNSPESYIIFELNQSKHMEQSVDFASLVQKEFSAIGRVDKGVRQAGFWVLAATSMPAVLVELDFICNPTQEKFLASEAGQKKMAKAICKAFGTYKETYNYYRDDSRDTKHRTTDRVSETTSQRTTETEESQEETEYRIQFLSSGDKLPKNSRLLKGLKHVDCYYDSGVYKYTTEHTTDKQKALKKLKEVQKKFKDAFLVEFKNGKRVK